MIAYGARKVTELLLKEKVIEKEYEEVYQYGTELLLSTALDFLIVLIMGAIFGRTEAGILYFLVLATVRTQAGGYHASTYFWCGCVYSITFLMVLGFVRVFSYICVNFAYLMLSLLINNIFIWSQAPVLHNRRMEDEEKRLARRNAGVSCMVWMCIAIFLYRIYPAAAYTILASGIMISVYMMIGKQKEGKIYESRLKKESSYKYGESD